MLGAVVIGIVAGWTHVTANPRTPDTTAASEAWYTTPSLVMAGEKTFQANCSGCHGASGEGEIGPNLTDAYWLHGGSADSILTTITQGVPGKGMPTWGDVLTGDKIREVVAYVFSLKETNFPDGKEP